MFVHDRLVEEFELDELDETEEEYDSEPQEIPVGFTPGQFFGLLGFGMIFGSLITLIIIAGLSG